MENRKAKTHKGRKILESKLPKIFEDPKNSLFVNTANSSEILRMVMSDLVIFCLFSSNAEKNYRGSYQERINLKQLSQTLKILKNFVN